MPAYKRCSASCLSCRYLKPTIKLKLIGLAIRLYEQFWKEMNCRIFHEFQMRAPEWPFERYISGRILPFAYLMCPSVSGSKALKNSVCDLPYSVPIKKNWSVRTKIALIEKIFRKKKSPAGFCCWCINLPTVKIWGQLDKFPMSFNLLQCPL